VRDNVAMSGVTSPTTRHIPHLFSREARKFGAFWMVSNENMLKTPPPGSQKVLITHNFNPNSQISQILC
jgi:hypothetical protein